MNLEEAIAHIDLLNGQIAALDAVVLKRDETIRTLSYQLQLAAYKHARLRHALFGHRSERVAPMGPTLPGVDMSPCNDADPEKPLHPKGKGKRTRKARTRKARPRLEVDPSCVTEHTTTTECDEPICPTCHREKNILGVEKHTRLERERPHYHRYIDTRIRRACGTCKQGVSIAPATDLPSGNGIMGPSLVVDTAVMHFHDHIPFHRIANVYKREGLTVDRATLCRATMRLAKALQIIVGAMESELLRDDNVVGIDGTGVKIFASPHCARRPIYVMHGLGHVVYRVLKSESAVNVLQRFQGFEGVVESDAATVHTGSLSISFGLNVALCGAHGRRKFKEAYETDRTHGNVALRFYQTIANHERQWRDLSPLDRQRERERVLRPVFDTFKQWLDEERPKLMNRSPMAGAFDYTLRHWEGLSKFLTDGRIPWTNNESERLLRHLVVGRKSWVFRGSFLGAERGCILWSLMMSCKMHGVNPRQYLLDVLAEVDTTPQSRILDLTPREYAKRKRDIAQVA